MNTSDRPNPGKPLDARLLLYLFIGFFVIPGFICGGCVAASAYIPRRFVQPKIERPHEVPNEIMKKANGESINP